MVVFLEPWEKILYPWQKIRFDFDDPSSNEDSDSDDAVSWPSTQPDDESDDDEDLFWEREAELSWEDEMSELRHRIALWEEDQLEPHLYSEVAWTLQATC